MYYLYSTWHKVWVDEAQFKSLTGALKCRPLHILCNQHVLLIVCSKKFQENTRLGWSVKYRALLLPHTC